MSDITVHGVLALLGKLTATLSPAVKTRNVGKCEECGRSTSSGMDAYCHRCTYKVAARCEEQIRAMVTLLGYGTSESVWLCDGCGAAYDPAGFDAQAHRDARYGHDPVLRPRTWFKPDEIRLGLSAETLELAARYNAEAVAALSKETGELREALHAIMDGAEDAHDLARHALKLA